MAIIMEVKPMRNMYGKRILVSFVHNIAVFWLKPGATILTIKGAIQMPIKVNNVRKISKRDSIFSVK